MGLIMKQEAVYALELLEGEPPGHWTSQAIKRCRGTHIKLGNGSTAAMARRLAAAVRQQQMKKSPTKTWASGTACCCPVEPGWRPRLIRPDSSESRASFRPLASPVDPPRGRRFSAGTEASKAAGHLSVDDHNQTVPPNRAPVDSGSCRCRDILGLSIRLHGGG